jgi:hypothetical protein
MAALRPHHNRRRPIVVHYLCALIVAHVGVLTGCGTLEVSRVTDRLVASNERDWSPQFRILPRAVIAGDQVTLYNIRNNVYLSEKDFIVQHYDRLFSLTDIQTVDFIVVPFQGMESIAHTMLSFGLADGTQIAVSVEVRTEKGESYTTAMGLANQFEITYVVADEKDLIRLRTRHRHAEVYLYPSRATPEQAQQLFVDIMQRVNKLAERPEFYDTITNNCTNNLVRHVNRVMPNKIPRAWQILLSGHSDRYAYDLGLLDQSVPFEQLKEIAHINDLVDEYYDAPDFSIKIRSRVSELSSQTLDPSQGERREVEPRDSLPNARMPWSSRFGRWRETFQNQGRLRTAGRQRQQSDIPDPIELKIED